MEEIHQPNNGDFHLTISGHSWYIFLQTASWPTRCFFEMIEIIVKIAGCGQLRGSKNPLDGPLTSLAPISRPIEKDPIF